MALVIADRVRETTTTTGTGTITLAGPYTGFQAFSVIGNGNTTYYAIIDAATGAWEVGIGTYTTAGNTLSRTTILSSSNGGAAVNFGVGTKDVIITQPAARAVYLDTASNATIPGITLSGGTANGVAYLNGSKVLTTGSALTFDGTTQALTAASGYGAYRVGGVSGGYFDTYNSSGTKIGSFGSENGGDMYLGTRVNNPIIFLQNNAEQMRLTSTGLGIGTSSPGAKLDVVNAAGRAARIGGFQFGGTTTSTDGGNNLLSSGVYWNGSNLTATQSSGAVLQLGNGAIQLQTLSGLTAGNTYSFAPQFTLDSSGNVGIGTSSPASKLHVVGDVRIGAGGRALFFNSGNTSYGYIGAPTTDSSLAFYTNSEAMRLDASGNLGIGTSSPAYKLDVNGSAKFAGNYVSFNDNGYIRTDAANILRFQPGSGGYQFRDTGNGSNLAVLDASGNLGLGVTPSALLWPNGSTGGLQLQAGALLSAYNAATYLSNNWYYNAGEKYIGNGYATRYEQISGKHAWYTAGNNTSGAGATVSWTQAMTLDASGNLGVGLTYIPSNQGNAIAVGNASGANISITSNTAAGTSGAPKYLDLSYRGYNNFELARIRSWDESGSTGFGYLTFWTNNGSTLSERARIDSSGNLGLGVTPQAGKKLDILIAGTSSDYAIQTRSDTAGSGDGSTTNRSLRAVNSNATAWASSRYEAYSHIWGIGGSASISSAMTLDASGNLLLGTTSGTGLKFDFSPTTAQQNGINYVNSSPNSYTDIYGCGTSGGWIGSIRFFTSNNAAAAERARIDSSGNLIQSAPTTPPSLATNGTMVFNLTSNTNLRVSVRGSDGVTRTANITLA